MKEISFLKQNAEKWEAFEKMLDERQLNNPKKLAELFIELTDDLSYARTYYPQAKSTEYLNGLTARVHQEIYKSKKESRSRLKYFWKEELPDVMRQHQLQLFISFAVFAIACLIGAVSAAYDENFVRVILGDSYVNQTIENINNNDPMAVYKKMHQADMFIGITVNNIRVSFIAFVFGVFFSLGTGYFLFFNGIMLGSFQYFFYTKGLLMQSALVIWIHGTLEISAIIIAGAAGFAMGNSILFPGTYPRGASFIMGAKKGIKIIVGLIPVFICAGFLESFVTRYTQMPIWLSLGIIITSFLFISWYFVVYPFARHSLSKNIRGMALVLVLTLSLILLLLKITSH
ncbi:MAG: stage II sporulation protein M [Bacteroidia bacterium]